MNREAGKGSKPRPYSISKSNFDSNWDRTFKSSPVSLENPLNQEIWYCNDYRNVKVIDGIDYIEVYKKESPNRTHLMNKSALKKV